MIYFHSGNIYPTDLFPGLNHLYLQFIFLLVNVIYVMNAIENILVFGSFRRFCLFFGRSNSYRCRLLYFFLCIFMLSNNTLNCFLKKLSSYLS